MRCAGAPGAPVAVNVTGLPVSPGAVAVRVLVPAVIPSVQLPTVAIPLALVIWFAPVMLPPPPASAKVTATPWTGLPLASFTITDGGTATAVPVVAVCWSPAFTAIWVAAPAVTSTVADVTPVKPVALKPRVRGPTVPMMDRLVNTAVPAELVVAVAVPPSVPPPDAIAAVTVVPL